ncbi:MAG: hypothetical protein JSS49_08515 [Planctomycetes bacterium]|nr:hypothetical protein [Planctomycetota bacterium]
MRAVGQPWEGDSVRSRLWAAILRELPFPFREIGTEFVRFVVWLDRTAARIWLGLSRSPAWYLVMATGTIAVGLTALLFSSSISNDDPTVGELVSRSQVVSETRESLEDAGDWTAQDKWRLAHMFVNHRPPRTHVIRQLDSRLVDDFPSIAASPLRRDTRRRTGFNSRYEYVERDRQLSQLELPDFEVRLDLNKPQVAEQPKRLVYGLLVRDSGGPPVRQASNTRTRDSRLLVQAEWKFASDCDNHSYQPVRRPIPVPLPDPRWDELPPVTQERHPDLSFQMSMLRAFLPDFDHDPPGSHVHTVTVHSEFPDADFRRRLPSDGFSTWVQTTRERRHPDRPADAYVDLIRDQEPEMAPEPVDHRGSVPSFAEIGLRLELTDPETTVVGKVNYSSLVLRNDGLQPIPQVTVHESLAHLETVTDAIPAARFNEAENSLERRVHLEPGRDQRLELAWRPDTVGPRTHSAVVTVQAEVGTLTEIVKPEAEQPMPSVVPEPLPFREPVTEPEPIEPEPIREPEPEPVPQQNPSLSFDVQNLPRAMVDDLVEIGIVVRNTGDIPLHGVRVVVQLPEQLKHRGGTEVEYTIPHLPVHGTERTVLRTVAQSTGRAICHLQVSADEPTDATAKAIINIDARPAARITKAEPPRSLPPAPVTILKRAPAAPNCCCQSQPVMFGPWDLP